MTKHQLQTETRGALLRRGVILLLEQGASISTILERLIDNVEGQSDSMLAAIFFYDPQSNDLKVGAAPHMQPGYVRAVNGYKIGPMQAACGAVVFQKERLIATDVMTDSRWTGLRDVATSNRIRAVWSEPIFHDDGDVIGTLAFYFAEPREPAAEDLLLMEQAAKLAAFAMQSRKDDVLGILESRRRELA